MRIVLSAPHRRCPLRGGGATASAAWLLSTLPILSTCGVLGLGLSAIPATAGVTNPQISIIGQPSISWSNDEEDPDRKRPRIDVGETEIVYDDYLNPYARGFFAMAVGEEGLELEEGYFTLFRGLPLDLALRGGQFRVPFGRLNVTHAHALPFAEPFEVVTAYLPGEEALIEPGVELSRRIPIVGDVSILAEVDWLQGNSFRIERDASDDAEDPILAGGDDGSELTRPAFLGRLSGFGMIGERSALELGVSAVGGTNNVDAGTQTRVLGLDAKAKIWTSPVAYLLLQGEFLSLSREEAEWEAGEGYVSTDQDGVGGYVFADYNFRTRYNLGASFEHFEEPTAESLAHTGFGLFGGVALMEETTAIRLDWKRLTPEGGEGVDALTLRVIYSMGPHKAHQF